VGADDDRNCVHDWQLVEVLLEPNAADQVSACTRCGATGIETGQGRRVRPALPDIEYTGADQLDDQTD
jgi:hypothetical protein